jgi:mannose-6-phosphate isomerase-like protein (cupin superfamily)
MESININNKLDLITDLWKPRVIAELNGQHVKISKVKGEFVWHDHKEEDELFYILKGKMIMEFRDKKVEVNEGEMILVPKGVEHRPIAKNEVWMMLFEPKNIKHTGDVESELTIKEYKTI